MFLPCPADVPQQRRARDQRCLGGLAVRHGLALRVPWRRVRDGGGSGEEEGRSWQNRRPLERNRFFVR